MDPPLPASPSHSSGSTIATKLRLMCSYGGHIVPRPRTKSLCYLGGETRIVSISAKTTTTLSSFISHLSATLSIKHPFTLKYQLPHLDLDSLISLYSDDDLLLMLDEQLRLSSSSPPPPSSTPSRIRLFLFCSNPESKIHNVFHHHKTEDWYVDALNSARIWQKATDCSVGFDGEGVSDGGEAKTGGCSGNGIVSLAESMVLETSSSFGSSSSSASLTNLPSIKAHDEYVGVNLLDSSVKLTSSDPIDSLASDSSIPNVNSRLNTGTHQELVAQASSIENNISSNPLNSETMILDPTTGVPAYNMMEASGYGLPPQYYPLQQQPIQFVQAGAHSVPQNLSTMSPILSYYPVHQPQLHQQPFQQQNPFYPLYFLPVGNTQLTSPYNFPLQCSLMDTSTHISTQAPVSLVLPQAGHNNMIAAPPKREPSSQFHRTAPMANQSVHKPYDESQQQSIPVLHVDCLPQSTDTTSNEFANYGNEIVDDLAHIDIYKSQPPPPAFPSRYQTMTKANKTLLSEALAQIQMNSIKPQIDTTQSQ